MFSFLGRRFLQALPVAALTTTLVFFLIHLVPGDPVAIMLGDASNAADRANLTRILGLDQPLFKQYYTFLAHIFSGSWGTSLTYDRSVIELIYERFFPTLHLTICALVVSLFISIPLGVIAATQRGKFFDFFSVGFSLLAASIPNFVLAPIAVLIFSVQLGFFHVSGYQSAGDLILPSLCLGLGVSGYFTRIVRTATLEVLHEDYILTARSKGLSEINVLLKHVLKNASIPLITVIGGAFGGLLAGAVVTETLFDWPGIGRLFFNAFQARDYPLVQGIVLWVSFSFLIINILVDLAYSWVDRRVQRN